MPPSSPHPLVAAQLDVPGNPALLTALPDQAAGLLCPECYDQAPTPASTRGARDAEDICNSGSGKHTRDYRQEHLWRKNS